MALGKGYTLPVRFTAKDGYSATLRGMSKQTVGFGKKATLGLGMANVAMNRLNKSMKLGRTLSTGLNFGIGYMLFSGLRTAERDYADFDTFIMGAAAKFKIFSRNAVGFIKIQRKARELGMSTEFKAGEVAEGINILAGSGFNLEQSMAGLSTVLDLATASQSDFATAADVSTLALTQLGMVTDNSKELAENFKMVANVLNYMKVGSKFASLEEIKTTLGYVTKEARNVGMEFHESATLMSLGMNLIGDASKVGTSLRMFFQKMTKNKNKILELTGVDITDGKGNYKHVFDVLEELRDFGKTQSVVAFQDTIMKLFGTRQTSIVTGFIEILKNSDKLREFADTMESISRSDFTSQIAFFQRKSYENQKKLMYSAFSEVGISFMESYRNNILSFFKSMAGGARDAATFIKDNQGFLMNLLGAVKMLIGAWITYKALMITKIFMESGRAISQVTKGVWGLVTANLALIKKGGRLGVNAARMTKQFWKASIALAAIAVAVTLVYKAWARMRLVTAGARRFNKVLNETNASVTMIKSNSKQLFRELESGIRKNTLSEKERAVLVSRLGDYLDIENYKNVLLNGTLNDILSVKGDILRINEKLIRQSAFGAAIAQEESNQVAAGTKVISRLRGGGLNEAQAHKVYARILEYVKNPKSNTSVEGMATFFKSIGGDIGYSPAQMQTLFGKTLAYDFLGDMGNIMATVGGAMGGFPVSPYGKPYSATKYNDEMIELKNAVRASRNLKSRRDAVDYDMGVADTSMVALPAGFDSWRKNDQPITLNNYITIDGDGQVNARLTDQNGYLIPTVTPTIISTDPSIPQEQKEANRHRGGFLL